MFKRLITWLLVLCIIMPTVALAEPDMKYDTVLIDETTLMLPETVVSSGETSPELSHDSTEIVTGRLHLGELFGSESIENDIKSFMNGTKRCIVECEGTLSDEAQSTFFSIDGELGVDEDGCIAFQGKWSDSTEDNSDNKTLINLRVDFDDLVELSKGNDESQVSQTRQFGSLEDLALKVISILPTVIDSFAGDAPTWSAIWSMFTPIVEEHLYSEDFNVFISALNGSSGTASIRTDEILEALGRAIKDASMDLELLNHISKLTFLDTLGVEKGQRRIAAIFSMRAVREMLQSLAKQARYIVEVYNADDSKMISISSRDDSVSVAFQIVDGVVSLSANYSDIGIKVILNALINPSHATGSLSLSGDVISIPVDCVLDIRSVSGTNEQGNPILNQSINAIVASQDANAALDLAATAYIGFTDSRPFSHDTIVKGAETVTSLDVLLSLINKVVAVKTDTFKTKLSDGRSVEKTNIEQPDMPIRTVVKTVEGFLSDIEVSVGIYSDGTIANVQVGGDSFTETPGLGGQAKEKDFTDQFIGASAPVVYGKGIDAITGATTTSNAILRAINEALSATVVRPSSDFYVLDNAYVLSSATKAHIIYNNDNLYKACGAQIVFVTIDTFGDMRRDDYAYTLFNQWGIGSKEKNNGLLIILAIDDDDGYFLQGSGLEASLPTSELGDLVDKYMMPYFDKKDYDTGCLKLFDALFSKVASVYNTDVLITDYYSRNASGSITKNRAVWATPEPSPHQHIEQTPASSSEPTPKMTPVPTPTLTLTPIPTPTPIPLPTIKPYSETTVYYFDSSRYYHRAKDCGSLRNALPHTLEEALKSGKPACTGCNPAPLDLLGEENIVWCGTDGVFHITDECAALTPNWTATELEEVIHKRAMAGCPLCSSNLYLVSESVS